MINIKTILYLDAFGVMFGLDEFVFYFLLFFFLNPTCHVSNEQVLRL